ncbi:MAG: hypothetical protein ACLQRM_13285 [Acidimicrobiales bacterium]
MDRAANNLAIGQFTDEGGTPEYGLEGRCKKELELGGRLLPLPSGAEHRKVENRAAQIRKLAARFAEDRP